MMRISIRSLLMLLVIITLPLAGTFNRYSGKRKLAHFLESAPEDSERDRPIGVVRWSYQLNGWYDYTKRAPKHHGPKWIRNLFGDDAFAYIKRARVTLKSQEESRKAMKLLWNGDSLRGLEELHVIVGKDVEFNARCLARLDDVRTLKLDGLSLDEDDFRAISKIEDLEVLLFSGCKFEAESTKPLTNCKHLAWFKVSQQLGTSKAVPKLRKLLPRTYISYDSRER